MLPTVTKATLTTTEGGLTFTFQFNPTTLELVRSVSWDGAGSKRPKKAKEDSEEEADIDSEGSNSGEMGAPWPRLAGASGEKDKLNFATLFDQSEDHDAAELSASSLERQSKQLASFASLVPGLPAAMSLLPGNTKDIVDQIEALYKMTLHQKIADTVIRPPMLTFTWGSKFIFTGVLTSVSFAILQFDANGRATRADVKCEMEGRFGKGRTKIFETSVVT